MAMTPRLDLRQSQNLVMTPQLQQAIKLLQLNNMEVTTFVEGELEQNPMLERDEGQNDPSRGQNERTDPFENNERPADGAGDSLEQLQPTGMTEEASSPLDADFSNQYDGEIAGAGVETSAAAPAGGDGADSPYWTGATGGGGGFDGDLGDLEATLSHEVSLRDHLLDQLTMEVQAPADRIIGAAMIDMLDDAGWLTAGTGPVADMLGCAAEDVERVLAVLQGFDPAGIFARDLQECLALQLKEQDRFDPAMAKLVDNLDLLAARDGKSLMKLCGVDAEDLAEMAAEIRALNPKPATLFEHIVVQPVTPDVLMRRTEDGQWLVELNPETMPRVLVNDSYFAKISKESRSKDENEYLTERYQSANWLVKSLHQRATTIIKVAGEIVRQQHGFFEHGVGHLRPLVLRDIAEAIEMHESTVSRVTSNKYISTPRGLFELKYFFTSAIAGTGGGESHSAESVRHRIKALIDGEEPERILSDDRIVDILQQEGIDIARRTVAKYRESMKSPRRFIASCHTYFWDRSRTASAGASAERPPARHEAVLAASRPLAGIAAPTS